MIDTPAIDILINHLIRRWPEHRKFVHSSFANRPAPMLAVSEKLAECILKLAGDQSGELDALCDDYRFLCEEIVLPEEIHFRRKGSYRLSSFADAEAECYANGAFMGRYMNGLLLSDVLWVNHANAFGSFVIDYLPRLREGSRHLEIGPGHGLFLYFAAIDPRVAEVSGWDVSPTSIAKTRQALELLQVADPSNLKLQDLFDASPVDEDALFDSVTMSEILEHLEEPVAALKAARRFIKPGGLLFVNVPANSPAPDHIFLFDDLQHAERVVVEGGFSVEDSYAFPMVGATLDQARKHKLSVSCVIVARN